ncbi:MAG: pyridoxal phosphate-dependent aminotransferase [Hyphomicrobium sp.]|nr:pyridoxal phosphate-dependent aminotransferase [Hyphomicrobium sp.]
MRRPHLSETVARLPFLKPFVGPETLERERGRAFRARLGANESAFGPSPLAVARIVECVSESWKYCDPENYELRTALAAFHGVGIENVVIGEGIDGLLGLAVKIASDPGKPVVTSDGAYPTFNFHVAAHGAQLLKVPFRADREDITALLDRAIAANARILYLSNPNNPMGTWWTASEIEGLIRALPDNLLLLLDEAYCDTAPEGAIPPVDVKNRQVLRLRTFSKAYGLAGLRMGYALGERDLVQTFEKVRNHYGINRTGQVGALAALEDQAHLAIVVRQIARARDRISDIARANGLAPIPSATNFVAIDCGRDGDFARRVLDGLMARDVFARKPLVAGLDRTVRISCGLDRELDLFAEALPGALADAGG